jgi:hypothetical protein
MDTIQLEAILDLRKTKHNRREGKTRDSQVLTIRVAGGVDAAGLRAPFLRFRGYSVDEAGSVASSTNQASIAERCSGAIFPNNTPMPDTPMPLPVCA